MKELDPTVETLETDQLIDLKTKISLATFVKLSEVTTRKHWKRGLVVETALSEYLDMQIYRLDKVELAGYESMLENHKMMTQSTIDRLIELKRRIAKYESNQKTLDFF